MDRTGRFTGLVDCIEYNLNGSIYETEDLDNDSEVIINEGHAAYTMVTDKIANDFKLQMEFTDPILLQESIINWNYIFLYDEFVNIINEILTNGGDVL